MTIFEAINIVMELTGRVCLGATCIYLIIDYVRNTKRIFTLILKRALIITFLISCLFCPIMPIITGYVVVIGSTIGACWQIT